MDFIKDLKYLNYLMMGVSGLTLFLLTILGVSAIMNDHPGLAVLSVYIWYLFMKENIAVILRILINKQFLDANIQYNPMKALEESINKDTNNTFVN